MRALCCVLVLLQLLNWVEPQQTCSALVGLGTSIGSTNNSSFVVGASSTSTGVFLPPTEAVEQYQLWNSNLSLDQVINCRSYSSLLSNNTCTAFGNGEIQVVGNILLAPASSASTTTGISFFDLSADPPSLIHYNESFILNQTQAVQVFNVGAVTAMNENFALVLVDTPFPKYLVFKVDESSNNKVSYLGVQNATGGIVDVALAPDFGLELTPFEIHGFKIDNGGSIREYNSIDVTPASGRSLIKFDFNAQSVLATIEEIHSDDGTSVFVTFRHLSDAHSWGIPLSYETQAQVEILSLSPDGTKAMVTLVGSSSSSIESYIYNTTEWTKVILEIGNTVVSANLAQDDFGYIGRARDGFVDRFPWTCAESTCVQNICASVSNSPSTTPTALRSPSETTPTILTKSLSLTPSISITSTGSASETFVLSPILTRSLDLSQSAQASISSSRSTSSIITESSTKSTSPTSTFILNPSNAAAPEPFPSTPPSFSPVPISPSSSSPSTSQHVNRVFS